MSTVPPDYASQTQKAVAHYWRTLDLQKSKQEEGDADRGNRRAVTGGQQMNGFCHLISEVLLANGLSTEHIHLKKKLELPGYFRATKKWDMVVLFEGKLVAALEFKSMASSFGKNLNNRAEEALGAAMDMKLAYTRGAFENSPRPWLGWLMLLANTKNSTTPMRVQEPHFKVLPEFRGKSVAGRFELLLRKLVEEELFSSAALLMSTIEEGQKGLYTEPVKDLAVEQFLSSLAGHIQRFREQLR